ncbi:MAG TPA: hypothetical protein VFS00_18190 [Polyangiaceae bacterium]|nr:hypothetical protein [Polyangiaceae bacterium]
MYPVVYSRFFEPSAAANDRVWRGEEAGPLLARVPDLVSLQFTLHEAWPGRWQGGTGYLRDVAPAGAEARFELPCLYGYCRGGTFDLTAQVLAGLARRSPRFEGACSCSGRHGSLGCTRRVRFVATATYRVGAASDAGPRLSPLEPGCRSPARTPSLEPGRYSSARTPSLEPGRRSPARTPPHGPLPPPAGGLS